MFGSPMTTMRWASLLLALAPVLAAACGGGNEARGRETTTAAGVQPRTRDGGGPVVGGTVGALDAAGVHRAIAKAMVRADGCLTTARKRLPVVGGEVALHVVVDANGRTAGVELRRSTLGHHEAEACIVKAFESQDWPRPVGGETGLVDHTMSLTPGTDEPAREWTADRLRDAMARDGGGYDDLLRKLGECKSEAGVGPLQVTVYVDEDGIAQSVGVSGSDGRAHEAASCVDAIVRATSFPPSADPYVKVTLGVE
jgi:hypothetical protein